MMHVRLEKAMQRTTIILVAGIYPKFVAVINITRQPTTKISTQHQMVHEPGSSSQNMTRNDVHFYRGLLSCIDI